MDDPLVPEGSLKGNTKYLVYGGSAAVLIVATVGIILAIVYGGKKSHPGYFLLGFAGAGFLLITIVLLRWLVQNTVEDKIKYVLIAQFLFLLLLAIGLYVEALRKDPEPCPATPVCPNEPPCYTQLIAQLAASDCQALKPGASQPNCFPGPGPLACFMDAQFNAPYNATMSVSIVA